MRGCVDMIFPGALFMVALTFVAGVDKSELADYLKGHVHGQPQYKRVLEQQGNPCPDPDKPFPCKTGNVCLPMKWVCDKSEDCPEGYDEEIEVCTAAHRPPVEDIIKFLNTNNWILEKLFAGNSPAKVAHGLAVSPTIEDFKKRLQLSERDIRKLRAIMRAVKDDNERILEKAGMPRNSWGELAYIFNRLSKSGFN